MSTFNIVFQKGIITIPKSTKRERVVENSEVRTKTLNWLTLGWTYYCNNEFLFHFSEVFGFQLEEEDMEAINNLHDGRHVSWDPTNVK